MIEAGTAEFNALLRLVEVAEEQPKHPLIDFLAWWNSDGPDASFHRLAALDGELKNALLLVCPSAIKHEPLPVSLQERVEKILDRDAEDHLRELKDRIEPPMVALDSEEHAGLERLFRKAEQDMVHPASRFLLAWFFAEEYNLGPSYSQEYVDQDEEAVAAELQDDMTRLFRCKLAGSAPPYDMMGRARLLHIRYTAMRYGFDDPSISSWDRHDHADVENI